MKKALSLEVAQPLLQAILLQLQCPAQYMTLSCWLVRSAALNCVLAPQHDKYLSLACRMIYLPDLLGQRLLLLRCQIRCGCSCVACDVSAFMQVKESTLHPLMLRLRMADSEYPSVRRYALHVSSVQACNDACGGCYTTKSFTPGEKLSKSVGWSPADWSALLSAFSALLPIVHISGLLPVLPPPG